MTFLKSKAYSLPVNPILTIKRQASPYPDNFSTPEPYSQHNGNLLLHSQYNPFPENAASRLTLLFPGFV
jgi:hypothetical protein